MFDDGTIDFIKKKWVDYCKCDLTTREHNISPYQYRADIIDVDIPDGKLRLTSSALYFYDKTLRPGSVICTHSFLIPNEYEQLRDMFLGVQNYQPVLNWIEAAKQITTTK